jgi:hypothetical protein
MDGRTKERRREITHYGIWPVGITVLSRLFRVGDPLPACVAHPSFRRLPKKGFGGLACDWLFRMWARGGRPKAGHGQGKGWAGEE